MVSGSSAQAYGIICLGSTSGTLGLAMGWWQCSSHHSRSWLGVLGACCLQSRSWPWPTMVSRFVDSVTKKGLCREAEITVNCAERISARFHGCRRSGSFSILPNTMGTRQTLRLGSYGTTFVGHWSYETRVCLLYLLVSQVPQANAT